MRRVAAIGVLLLTCASAGCAAVIGADPSAVSATPAAPTPSIAAVRSVFIVGDSNSTGFRGTLDVGLDAGEAWASALPESSFSPVRGWARDGATTAAMRDGAVGADARTDVLLIMGGTNDLAAGVDTDAILGNVSGIADGVDSSTVVLLAIAPFDARAPEATALNEAFQTMAREKGWEFLDPWAGMRRSDGTWVESATIDGVHATSQGYAAAGEAVARHLGGVR